MLAGAYPSLFRKSTDYIQCNYAIIKYWTEILTYEEVTLYLSKTGRKRPLVLCGPEGVGCLELRQRLAE
ncbi:unnamed protein product, partial [Cercopithifilaria johnstoni]